MPPTALAQQTGTLQDEGRQEPTGWYNQRLTDSIASYLVDEPSGIGKILHDFWVDLEESGQKEDIAQAAISFALARYGPGIEGIIETLKYACLRSQSDGCPLYESILKLYPIEQTQSEQTGLRRAA